MIRFTISGILAALGIIALIAAWLRKPESAEHKKARDKRSLERSAAIEDYYDDRFARYGSDGPQGGGGPTLPPNIPKPLESQDFMVASAVLFGLALLFFVCGFIPVSS